MHNRYFTDAEEHAIAEFIRDTFLKQNLLFTDADFRVIAIQAMLEKGIITNPTEFNEILDEDDNDSDNEEEANTDSENAENDNAYERDSDFDEDDEEADDESDWKPSIHVQVEPEDDIENDQNHSTHWIDEEADDEDEAEFVFPEEDDESFDESLLKKQVCMGSHFISNFKKRNGFSSRRSRFSRRPVTSEDKIGGWKAEMKNLFATVSLDRIVNCDETSWQLFPNGILTWADTGSDNIQTKVNGNTKDSITVMGTITAANTKLPLHMIAKGSTERAEISQFGDISYHKSTHSTNG